MTMARIMSDDHLGGAMPVDLTHLSRQTFGDHDLEREVLALFERQSRTMLERLRNATSAKSSALGIGAFGVAQAAEAVECDQVDHLSSRAWDDLARLEQAVAEANGFIANLLKAA